MRLYLMVFTGLFCPLLFAQPPAPQTYRADIDDSAAGYQGNVMLNQAAGDGQQQSNARAISVNPGSSTSIQVRQRQDAPAVNGPIDANSRITGSAFSQGSGVLGVNQAAGIGNQQINAFRMTLSAAPESLDDSVLSQSTAAPTYSGSAAQSAGERSVEIDDAAFRSSSGVVQLNQSAGVGNRSTNSVSIRLLD